VHAEPPAGEIYVIAVDPRASGRGLGAALLTAGLTHLHDRRGMREAILYVEATNAPARTLYQRYRFSHDHTDRRYRLELQPETPSGPR
jgi:mycothiol synthase